MDADMLELSDDDMSELFFEEPEEVAPPPPPKPEAKRKAKKMAAPAVDLGEDALFAEAKVALSQPLPVPAAETSVEADAEPKVERHAPLPRLVLVALVLAVVASLFSAIGLLVAARTVTAASLARDEAMQQTATAQRIDHAIREVEALAKAQRRVMAANGGTPLTVDAMRSEMDALRQSLAKTQPAGTSALAGVVRQGQQELSGRIDDLESRIDAISAKATRASQR